MHLRILVTAGSVLFYGPVLSAQVHDSIGVADFLADYREAVPKLSKALFQNKTIHMDSITHNTSDPLIWRYSADYVSNEDRFMLSVNVPKNAHPVDVRIFRPDQLYILNGKDNGALKTITSRPVAPSVSEAIVAGPWWLHPHLSATSGVGHGLLNSNVDWYSLLAEHSDLIREVLDSKDGDRECYKVVMPEVKPWSKVDVVLFFDKKSLLCYRTTAVHIASDKSRIATEQIVDFSMNNSGYDSLAINSYRKYSEHPAKGIARHLETEQSFPIYKTETHPPETFRLEQFGLPDVEERPKGTSRTSIALIAAGVVIGVLLFVTWLRGRRRARVA